MTAVPLHNHSTYSTLDGYSTPIEIAARVEELGCPCCGLTDHGTNAGHLEFAKELTKRGIKPIFGTELYQGTKTTGFKGQERDASHLIVLAQTQEGLRNLWRLNSAASHPEQVRFAGQPRAFAHQISHYKEGLIATSACALSLVNKGIKQGDLSWFDWYLEEFGDNFYLELHTYTPDKPFKDSGSEGELWSTRHQNEALVDLGLERGVEFVYADDAHFARPDQYLLHDAYVALSTGDMIFTPPDERKMWHPNTLYIKSEEEIRDILSYLPEAVVDNAIENSLKIAESCTAELPEVRRHMPIFVPAECPWLDEKDDRTAGEVFVDLVTEGIIDRYGEDAGDEVWDRAFREVEVFLRDGLEHMFLMDWDKNQFCDHEEILRGPGRGSAAGCIVAYALGITDVDPLHYDLFFERFWNPGRAKGFPDIDGDHARAARQRVIDYLKRRWDKRRVALIGNVNRMKPKAALKRMFKAYGVSEDEMNALKKIVDDVPDIEILGSDQIAWSREHDPDFVLGGKARPIYVMEHVGDEIEEYVKGLSEVRQKLVRRYLDAVGHAVNRVEGYGIHASGVVVSDVDLDCELPFGTRGKKDDRRQATEFPMDDVDGRQFVKLDVLGLKTLDTLAEWQRQVALKGIEIEWSGLDKQEWPYEMWKLLHDGFSAGIFQVEGGLASHIAKEFKPVSVLDLSIIVALNRPGPIRSGAPESFIKRRRGETDDKFDGRKVSMLKDILEETYGWFLYQEQVIAFFTKLGYNLSDADAVRKILGKKQPEKWLDLYHGRDEWEGKGFMDMAAKAGLGDIRKTEAAKWDGEDVTSARGVPLFPRVKDNAWVIWRMIVDFAKYSFNKSHSVAYAIIGFRTLLAKYYAPSEFYMACVATVEKNKKALLIPTYVNEARRMDIKVLPPDIERSMDNISVWEDGDIYWGLGDVGGVATGGEALVRFRDVELAPVQTPEELFDWIEEKADVVKKQRARWRKEGTAFNAKEKTPKQMLGENKITALYTAGAWERLEGYPTPLADLQQREKETLSVILSDNSEDILRRNSDVIRDADCDPYEEALEPYTGDRVYHLPGTIIEVEEKTIKQGPNKGKKMGVVTIEYEGDTIKFPVFNKQWNTHKFLWRERAVGIFHIRHAINNKTGEPGYSFKEGIKLA